MDSSVVLDLWCLASVFLVAKVRSIYIVFGFGPKCCITLCLGVRLERSCVRRHNEATNLEKGRVLTSQFSE